MTNGLYEAMVKTAGIRTHDTLGFYTQNTKVLQCRHILKGSGHYWQLLKIMIIIKPFLITSNGERLTVLNIVRKRNSSLCSNVVFKKEVIFHEFDFETSSLEFEVSKSSI